MLSIAVLVLLFPAFDVTYGKGTFLAILLVQAVAGYAIAGVFWSQWVVNYETCITEADARKLNNLLLRYSIARCKCRFSLFTLVLIVYMYYTDMKCIGYTPSPGCQEGRGNNNDDMCTELLYCVCACFYYTTLSAQLIHITKNRPIDRNVTMVLKCTAAIVLWSALVYSIASSVSSGKLDTRGQHEASSMFLNHLDAGGEAAAGAGRGV